ncbi:unnamed protein product, partial [Notodromas monacha]
MYFLLLAANILHALLSPKVGITGICKSVYSCTEYLWMLPKFAGMDFNPPSMTFDHPGFLSTKQILILVPFLADDTSKYQLPEHVKWINSSDSKWQWNYKREIFGESSKAVVLAQRKHHSLSKTFKAAGLRLNSTCLVSKNALGIPISDWQLPEISQLLNIPQETESLVRKLFQISARHRHKLGHELGSHKTDHFRVKLANEEDLDIQPRKSTTFNMLIILFGLASIPGSDTILFITIHQVFRVQDLVPLSQLTSDDKLIEQEKAPAEDFHDASNLGQP